jgi:integrase
MARPAAQDGIRARARSYDGIIEVHFAEHPGHWIVSPEHDRSRAIAWAKRNRDRLIRRDDLPIAAYCKDFYAKDGLWVRRQKEKGHHYGDLHLKNRQAYMDNYFCREFGSYRPADIDRTEFRREFDNWLLDLTSCKGDGKRLSRATKNKIIYSVNDFLEELIDLKKISMNPLTGLKKYSKDPEKSRGVIDRDSLSKMFPSHHGTVVRIWGSPMWACIMLVFYDTGARPGEVRALTWKDIDIRKRFIPFRKGIESGTANTIKGTKTDVVKAGFLSNRTIQELDIWRSQSKYAGDTDFVFTVNGKKPVTNEAICKAFRRGLTQIEQENSGWKPNPNWTPYWLRHSFGTYQMEILEEEEIAALMGNGVVVLKRHYQHPDDETLYRSSAEVQKKLDKAREQAQEQKQAAQ